MVLNHPVQAGRKQLGRLSGAGKSSAKPALKYLKKFMPWLIVVVLAQALFGTPAYASPACYVRELCLSDQDRLTFNGVVWTRNSLEGALASTRSGNHGFSSATAGTVGLGLTAKPFTHFLSFSGGNLAGASAAWENGTYTTYWVAAYANSARQITLVGVQIVTSSAAGHVQVQFPMQAQPMLEGGASYDFQTIMHDSMAAGTGSNRLRRNDFSVDAGVGEADLVVGKLRGTNLVASGEITTDKVDVTNTGGTVNGVIVRDTPGPGVTCPDSNPVTISGDGVPSGTYTIGNLTSTGIALGTLENGQTATLTYSCIVK